MDKSITNTGFNNGVMASGDGNNINTSQKDYSDNIRDLKNEINKLNEKVDANKVEKYPYINILVAIFGLTFLFFLLAVFLNKTYKFGISDDSVVLAFVGIVATFIVVSNYMQVQAIESKFVRKTSDFEKQVKEIQSDCLTKIEKTKIELREIFDRKIKDSRFISEATMLNKEGSRYREQGEYVSALRCYIRALNFVNNISEKIEIEGIISNIEFMQVYMDRISISLNERDAFKKVLQKSNHPSSESLINDFIMKLNILSE
jgi:hypothetical protein